MVNEKVEVGFKVLELLGKEHGVDTGLYDKEKLINPIQEITIKFRPRKHNIAEVVMLDMYWYWKDNRWNRGYKQVKFIGLIKEVYQGIHFIGNEVKIMKNITRKWDKLMEV